MINEEMMNPYRRGAENVPLKNINKDMPILVLVYDLRTDKLVEEKRINYGDAEERRYLGRISYWAFTNHCSVETYAIADIDLENAK